MQGSEPACSGRQALSTTRYVSLFGFRTRINVVRSLGAAPHVIALCDLHGQVRQAGVTRLGRMVLPHERMHPGTRYVCDAKQSGRACCLAR
jgi:hypothetical protein